MSHLSLPSETMVLKSIKPIDLSAIHEYINTENPPQWINDPELKIRFMPILSYGRADESIPLLDYPFLINSSSNETVMIYDLRSCVDTKVGLYENSYRVRYSVEYLATSLRTYLTAVWHSREEVISLDAIYRYAGILFGKWISNLIVTRFGLDFTSQMIISVLSMYYYRCLLTDTAVTPDPTIEGVVIGKALNLDIKYCINLIEGLPRLSKPTELLEAIKEAIPDRRLKNQNADMFYTIIQNAWAGANANKLIAVALEHPPTWITLAFIASTENSATRYGLGRFTKQTSHKTQAQFVAEIKGLVTHYINNPS